MNLKLKGRFELRSKHSGGFVLIEFAIALPLLILLSWGLATVSLKIFQLGKIQLADYVLESEAQYVIERITHQARTAKTVDIQKIHRDFAKITFVYHTVENDPNDIVSNVADVLETQIFIPNIDYDKDICLNINAKRKSDGSLSNPITGKNYFGDTKINMLKYDLDKSLKILHITLEMESLMTNHKLKINTAVFMPALES